MTKREACEELACQRIFGYGLADADPIEREVCCDVVKDIYAELAEPDEAMMHAGKHGEGDLAKILQKQSWQAMLWAAAGGGDG